MRSPTLKERPQGVTSVSAKTLLTIRSYTNKELKGYLYNDFLQKILWFDSLCDMLLLLEQIMDQLQFPQASLPYRSFYMGRTYRRAASKDLERKNYIVKEEKESNASARFVVHVQFRQNATWQGTIQWLEGNKKQHFRSALEMLHLMDEALDNK